MNILKNAYHSLFGIWRLAHFDADGMHNLDLTSSGYWRSFQAAIIGLPFFFLLSVLEKHLRGLAWEIISPGQPIDFHNYFLLQTLDYFAIWPTFALVMIPFCRLLKVDAHYATLVISYNWARVFAIAVLIPPYMLLAAVGLSSLVAGFLTLVVSIFVLVFQWFVIKTAIGGARLPAVAIVITDILLTGIISYGMTRLFGGVFIGAQ